MLDVSRLLCSTIWRWTVKSFGVQTVDLTHGWNVRRAEEPTLKYSSQLVEAHLCLLKSKKQENIVADAQWQVSVWNMLLIITVIMEYSVA